MKSVCSIVTTLTDYENDDQFWQFQKVTTSFTNCDKQLWLLYNFKQSQIVVTIVINSKKDPQEF